MARGRLPARHEPAVSCDPTRRSAIGSRRAENAGPSGVGGFKAEPDRYHLIISLACPWAHRTLIFRRLKGLESMISLSVVHWLLGERGWTFDPGPGVIPDPIFGASELREFYVKARPDYSGRVTVPVLWDKTDEHDRQQRIVGNHPHVQQRLRWRRRGGGRLLSERPAAGDRRGQRPHLSNGQQWRLSRRFRHLAGGLRRGVPGAVRDARLARGAAREASASSSASG